MNKRILAGLLAGVAASAAVLTGCSNNGDSSGTTASEAISSYSSESAAPSTTASSEVKATDSTGTESVSPSASASASAHSHNHSTDGGAAPAGMVAAKDAKFKVGEKVQITADHNDGMKGATGEVVGAYNTVVYEVNYTPVGGGKEVKNHKWVVQEELDAPAGTELKPGDTVTLKASHMDGMDGAKATIVSAKKEVAYMVNYTAGGTHYTNHKWVTDDELKAA